MTSTYRPTGPFPLHEVLIDDFIASYQSVVKASYHSRRKDTGYFGDDDEQLVPGPSGGKLG